MKQLMKLAAAAAAGAFATGSIVYAQSPADEPRAIVSLYHAAPGQQEALLRWLASQDRAAQAAGVRPMQLYVHTDGDSWDYMGVGPITTEAQDRAIDVAARRLGLAAGPRAGMELRKYILSHTDTFTVGPLTADQALARVRR